MMTSSRLTSAAIGFLLCSLQLTAAPTIVAEAAPPVLVRRGTQPAQNHPPPVTTGTTTLPAGVSGAYLLNESGEIIEIELGPKRLDGYISLRGDHNNDEGAPLTFFFKNSTLDGVELGFTTYSVHGAWYSFLGTIVRGSAQSVSEQGYYMLGGTLTEHDDANGREHPRTILLPIAGQNPS